MATNHTLTRLAAAMALGALASTATPPLASAQTGLATAFSGQMVVQQYLLVPDGCPGCGVYGDEWFAFGTSAPIGCLAVGAINGVPTAGSCQIFASGLMIAVPGNGVLAGSGYVDTASASVPVQFSIVEVGTVGVILPQVLVTSYSNQFGPPPLIPTPVAASPNPSPSAPYLVGVAQFTPASSDGYVYTVNGSATLVTP